MFTKGDSGAGEGEIWGLGVTDIHTIIYEVDEQGPTD